MHLAGGARKWFLSLWPNFISVEGDFDNEQFLYFYQPPAPSVRGVRAVLRDIGDISAHRGRQRLKVRAFLQSIFSASIDMRRLTSCKNKIFFLSIAPAPSRWRSPCTLVVESAVCKRVARGVSEASVSSTT